MPEQGDPTNSDRSENGETVLTAYAEATRCPEDRDLDHGGTLDEIARDTITDLLHRLERGRVHPGVILQQAYERYREEALRDEPGPEATAAYPFGCRHCDVERGKPCRWGCESWGLYGHTRLTDPEQLDDDEPEPAPSSAEQPIPL
ncbi:hypothetical protein ABZ897_16060 [Nonomuraea sp. NPDC046802]|uniref:hypothetical protein n=1 Tax=Nonomuraea sp. NPDC046802 TaxID=3154919 RepID=UPI0033C1979D